MDDEHFMRLAIKEAKKADFPYGAIIVKNEKVVARAGTRSKKSIDPTAHAEMTVIRKACKKLKSGSLEGCTLYSTCEPCPMCFGAIWWAKISKLVYGISLQDSSKLSGREMTVACDFLNHRSGNNVKIVKEFLKEECLDLFK